MPALPTRVGLAICLIALVAVFVTGPAHAQSSPVPSPVAGSTPTSAVSDDEVNRVSKGLYCPICQNVPLEVCQTDACARWREQVRELIAEGDTDQQVRAYFVDHFGSQTLGVPTNPVVQLLTIALPFALIAVVGLLIGINLVIWRNKHPPVVIGADGVPPAPAPTSQEDGYRARLEDEVKKRE